MVVLKLALHSRFSFARVTAGPSSNITMNKVDLVEPMVYKILSKNENVKILAIC